MRHKVTLFQNTDKIFIKYFFRYFTKLKNFDLDLPIVPEFFPYLKV